MMRFGQKHKNLLTNYEGVLTNRARFITGCERVALTGVDGESKWFEMPMVVFVDEGSPDFTTGIFNDFDDLDEAVFSFGDKVADKISGFSGKITAVSIGIVGDISYAVTPEYDKHAETNDAEWFDEGRLELIRKSNEDKSFFSEKRKGGIAKPQGIGRLR